jgi:hypothetical protein
MQGRDAIRSALDGRGGMAIRGLKTEMIFVNISERPWHARSSLTLPTATAVVAMSKTKLSPFFPGAASDRGLVPRAACQQRMAGVSKLRMFLLVMLLSTCCKTK